MSSTALTRLRTAKVRATILCALAAATLGFGVSGIEAAAVDATKQTNVMVPMRDGVRLATDIYLPEGEGPWPTVLQRTPYDKARTPSARTYTQHGYAFVIQDQRGRFASHGTYVPHENEVADGYDTVEWIAAQPFSNGKVGISGSSAVGIAANLAAAAAPPHLVAAFARVAPESLFFEGRFIGGAIKQADTTNWMRGQGVSDQEIDAYKRRVVLDDRWVATDFIFLRDQVQIPIYNLGGWYDLFLKGTVDNFRYLQDWGRPGARGRQKVRIGPFGHGPLSGDLSYPGSDVDAMQEELRWFDYWLGGADNGIADEPPVAFFMRAAARKGSLSPKNGWRAAATWPPENSRPTRLYLQPDLGLDWQAPAAGQSSTTYAFDPLHPVQTFGGLNLTIQRGPMDQREIAERGDYLRFQTARLDRDLELAGELSAELWVATDGPDSDFVVKLVDVYPDGYEALVVDNIQRARYRHGRRAEDVAMMTPGEPTLLAIDLWHTGIIIERGHRLAVHVTSSNYPRFEVNTNDGDLPGEDTKPDRVARNTIFHDAEHRSAIVLPVLDDTAPTLPKVANATTP
jgi:hypothetical protein